MSSPARTKISARVSSATPRPRRRSDPPSTINFQTPTRLMAQPAIGMIETKGLCALFEATDAALKAANVTFTGWEKIGSGYVTAFFRGDFASVNAATDAAAAPAAPGASGLR